jgi:RNA polymerase subunit RPABC4/transcription elongation factor Spt4
VTDVSITMVITLAVVGVLLYVIGRAFANVFGGRGKMSTAGAAICPACGSRGEARTRTKGSVLIEIVLWLCLIIPGLIYSLWRISSREKVCPACGAAGMIPVNTPRGQQLLTQFARSSSPP